MILMYFRLEDVSARQLARDEKTEESESTPLRIHTTGQDSSISRDITKGSKSRNISILPAVAPSFTLLVNVILLFVVLFAFQEKGPDSFPAIRPKTCEAASRWTQEIHYLINIFATILLWASNYYMQRLSACTRSEVDNAHQKGSWVDFGNMRFISWDRIVIWWILAISSLPIHLL